LIRAWRLCQAGFAETAFSGEGARRYGGRWNPVGLPVVYLAATQSLAALELLVHAERELLAQAYVAFAVDIPSQIIEARGVESLPKDWQTSYPPIPCQHLGQQWLQQSRSAVLAVPSAIIPEEINYLLNPQHSDYGRIKIHSPKAFHFDARLKS
jgi:RES domain-containing protein